MPARIIAFISGKGGTGKTSACVNTALVLAASGRRVIVIDADTAMANVGILLGIEKAPINLHNVLMGESDIKDAVYEGPWGLRYVPSGLSLERVRRLDYTRLKPAVASLAGQADFIFIDCPPQIGREVEGALQASNEAIIIMTPDPVSLSDGLKARAVADKSGSKTIGIALNMITGEKGEIRPRELEDLLDAKVLVELPFDIEVRKSAVLQIPVVMRAPTTPFSRQARVLAAVLAGAPLPEARFKKSLLQALLNVILFWRKR